MAEIQEAEKTRNRLTIEQRIALLQKKLAREQESLRTEDTNVKIIIGGMMIAMAKNDPVAKRRLVELIEKHVTRPADVKRIAPRLQHWKQELETAHQEKK